jgi:hypothetical protein
VQQLRNSLKFSTVHFKDANTPGYVHSYLDE